MKKILITILVLIILFISLIGYTIINRSSAEEVNLYSTSSGEEPLYINLQNGGIAKVNIVVEHQNEEKIEKISNKVYVLRDSINKVIGNESMDDKGNLDIDELRDKIKNKLILVFNLDDINVYYQDFVIQK